MGKQYDALNDEHIAFIEAQKIFFVGTATTDSKVNISPKGMDSLRKLWLSRLELSAEKTVAIFHKVSRNSCSIASNFVENIGCFGKLKIIGLDQNFLKSSMTE